MLCPHGYPLMWELGNKPQLTHASREMQSVKSEASRLQRNKQTKNTSTLCVYTGSVWQIFFRLYSNSFNVVIHYSQYLYVEFSDITFYDLSWKNIDW